MYKLTIGIPTYKRPEMLKKLLASILNNKFDKTSISKIRILVVDNDIDKTGQQTTEEMKNQCGDYFALNYHSYPEKGLSNVRNEILKCALEKSPDYILCIDDDEYASAAWIQELLSTVVQNGAEIAVGRVIPITENAISPAIAYGLKRPNFSNHQQIEFFSSSNFIISAKFLQANQLKFDRRFNLSGGEDSYFGVNALKKGAKIFWANDAIVYETIPEKRASINWLIKRSFRGGLTYTYILLLEKNYPLIMKKMLVNLMYISGGTVSLLLLPFRSKLKYWGLLKIAESLGSLTSLTGIKYNEYRIDRKF